MIAMAESRGYKTVADVLNAYDYGVPQKRRRAIIIASRVGAPRLPDPNAVRQTASVDDDSYPTAPASIFGIVDPDDPTAERHADGRWSIIDTAWYHDGGDGWTQDAIDFTYAGVAAVIQPFASYAQIELLAGGDPDALQPLRSLGEAVVDGLPATGYAFATRGSPFFGSTDFEAWLSEGPNGYQRIVLIVTPVDGQPNRVTFTRIGEPVVIEAPL